MALGVNKSILYIHYFADAVGRGDAENDVIADTDTASHKRAAGGGKGEGRTVVLLAKVGEDDTFYSAVNETAEQRTAIAI